MSSLSDNTGIFLWSWSCAHTNEKLKSCWLSHSGILLPVMHHSVLAIKLLVHCLQSYYFPETTEFILMQVFKSFFFFFYKCELFYVETAA